MRKKHKSVSPLKSKPLRNPGESLDRKMIDIFDKSVFHVVIIAVIGTTIIQAWLAWYNQKIADPLVISIVLSPVIVFSLARMYLTFREAKRIKLGRDGEKAVGQFFDRLLFIAAKVFLIIEVKTFNLNQLVFIRLGFFV